jgi:hypothetical protein
VTKQHGKIGCEEGFGAKVENNGNFVLKIMGILYICA